MNLTGKITGISSNFVTGKMELTVSVNEARSLTDGYDQLKDFDLLDIQIKKHRNRRSLNANAYFHVLVDKLADAVGTSKSRCKNTMLARYGQPLMVDDTTEAVIKTNIPVEMMLEDSMVHCWPCSSKMENGAEVIFYKIYRGSSTYDTKEMSILIDGTVSECKEVGIETIPPADLDRMLDAWERRKG